MSEQEQQTAETGRPYIERINARIGTLERRLDELDGRIATGQGSVGAQAFDKSERRALKDALRSLRSSDTLLMALAELVESIQVDTVINGHDLDERTEDAIERALTLVAEWTDGE